jgi:hypothetical protein
MAGEMEVSGGATLRAYNWSEDRRYPGKPALAERSRKKRASPVGRRRAGEATVRGSPTQTASTALRDFCPTHAAEQECRTKRFPQKPVVPAAMSVFAPTWLCETATQAVSARYYDRHLVAA